MHGSENVSRFFMPFLRPAASSVRGTRRPYRRTATHNMHTKSCTRASRPVCLCRHHDVCVRVCVCAVFLCIKYMFGGLSASVECTIRNAIAGFRVCMCVCGLRLRHHVLCTLQPAPYVCRSCGIIFSQLQPHDVHTSFFSCAASVRSNTHTYIP